MGNVAARTGDPVREPGGVPHRVPEMIEFRRGAGIRMVDVVREIEAIALAAGRSDDPDVVAACRRAQSLLARLRNDFLQDLIGDTAPSERAA